MKRTITVVSTSIKIESNKTIKWPFQERQYYSFELILGDKNTIEFISVY